MKKRWISLMLAWAVLLGAAGCGTVQSAAEPSAPEAAAPAALPEPEPTPELQSEAVPEPEPSSAEPSAAESAEETAPAWTEPDPEQFSDYDQDNDALGFDSSSWSYDAENGVYYQLGVAYCTRPETENETMGIFVPEAYFTAVDNGDGTYTCTVDPEGACGGYTAGTAPIVLPVDTPGYAYQAAPSSYNYSFLASYLEAGFVYVWAGMRGRAAVMGGTGSLDCNGGVPYGITDLKAAVRYYRFNEGLLPGDTARIFSFGMSGGGAQSALIGATGDSGLYYPYLESIGAAMVREDGSYISDAICGSMCWCPITSLDYADEAYEWNMGQYFDTGTRAEGTYTGALSDDLAAAFAEYINALGLTAEDGTPLELTEGGDGIFTSGSYYDYLLREIETSLNNFLSDTTFPYTYTARKIQAGNTETSATSGVKFERSSSVSQEPVVYETAQDYIDSLNADTQWVTYDPATNTATVSSIGDFVVHCKNAQKSVGAFDNPDNIQGENNLFGNGGDVNQHFDATEGALLEQNAEQYAAFPDWDPELPEAFAQDLASTDSLGVSMATRNNMYNPMYYLCDYYDGAGTSNVAKYWRIRTGIAQTDTALTVEENLKLALLGCDAVESVDFATVWAQPHTTAERTGNSMENFIAWVNDCLQ